MTDTKLIEIFCILDEFCKYFALELKKHTLYSSSKRRRNRAYLMPDSEVMTILILSIPVVTATSSHSIWATYATICARSFPTACPTTALREATEGRTSPSAVPADLCIGQMLRYIHYRLHTACPVPHQASRQP